MAPQLIACNDKQFNNYLQFFTKIGFTFSDRWVNENNVQQLLRIGLR